MSLRVAAALCGDVSHTKVAELRRWKERGGDPEELAGIQPDTLRALKMGTRLAKDEDFRRAVLRLASDRLESLVKQLRREAATPGASIRAGGAERLSGLPEAEASRSPRQGDPRRPKESRPRKGPKQAGGNQG